MRATATVVLMAFMAVFAPGQAAAASALAGGPAGASRDRGSSAPGPGSVPATPLEQAWAGLQAATVGSQKEALARADGAGRLAYLLDAAERVSGQLSRETYDPQAVVDAVGNEPAALYGWVRDRTFLAPYRGALRGPAGVLMDRVGSSLDRSLLLAEFLRLGGHSVRLAHTTLTKQQVGALRARLRPVPKAGAELPDSTSVYAKLDAQFLAAFEQRFHVAQGALSERFRELRAAADLLITESRRHAEQQARVVQSAIGPMDPSGSDDLTASLADHWWVQYEQGEQWIDLDTAAADGRAGENVAPGDPVEVDSLPEEQYCAIEIRVMVERWSQGSVTEREVLRHRLRTPDLVGEAGVIWLRHLPLEWPRGLSSASEATAERASSAIRAVRSWRPVLTVGSTEVSQASFTATGEIATASEPEPGASQPVVGGFGLLGGGGEETPDNAGSRGPPPGVKGVLTAEWIDYAVVQPGKPVDHFRRPSFDLIGPAARSGGKIVVPPSSDADRIRRGLELLGQTAIMVQISRPTPEFMMQQALLRLYANKEKLLAAAGAQKPMAPEEADLLLARIKPMSDLLWEYSLLRFRASPVGNDVYLVRPNIATVRVTPFINESRIRKRVRFDIVSNSVAVRPGTGQSPFAIRLSQGVADTAAERLVLGQGRPAQNTVDVFLSSSEQRTQPLVVRGKADGWNTAGWPPDVIALVRQSLEDQHAVVIPAQMVTISGSKRTGWWRVDPRDGTTIGVMDTGLHQALSEYVYKSGKDPWLDSHIFWYCTWKGAILTGVLLGAAFDLTSLLLLYIFGVFDTEGDHPVYTNGAVQG